MDVRFEKAKLTFAIISGNVIQYTSSIKRINVCVCII